MTRFVRIFVALCLLAASTWAGATNVLESVQTME